MNEVVNQFLLAGDNFMPEMHWEQSGFTYGACSPFTKKKKELRSLRKLEIQFLFTKMSFIKLIFKIILLMVNQKI